MEYEAGRRDFLKVLGVSLSGLAYAGCGSPSGAQTGATDTTVSGGTTTTNGAVVSISHSFLIEPGMTSEFDPATGAVLSQSLWSLPSEAVAAAPMLLRSFTPSQNDVAQFADESSRDVMPSAITRGVTSDPFAALMGTSLSGGIPDVLDIAGSALLAVLDGVQLDLGLSFFHADPNQSSPALRTISTRSGLPVEEDEGFAATRGNPAPSSVTLFGWRFQVRGIETASLGSCVKPPTKVTHFSIDVHHQNPNGSFKPVLNVHLGTYVDPSSRRRCFVLLEYRNFLGVFTLLSAVQR